MKTTTDIKQTALSLSIKTLLTAAILTSIISSSFADGPENKDFDSIPFRASQNTPKPNVIINFDNSGAMMDPAYDESGDFDTSGKYYGYFDDDDGDYLYDTDAKVFYKKEHAGNNKWKGKFLNWLTMRRIDVARKALIGGKISRCVKKDAQQVKITHDESGSVLTERCKKDLDAGDAEAEYGNDVKVYIQSLETARLADDKFTKIEKSSSNSNSNYHPYKKNTKFTIKADGFEVDIDGNGGTPDLIVKGRIALKPPEDDDDGLPTGIIQENESDFRFGLSVYNYNHDRLIEDSENSIYKNNVVLEDDDDNASPPDITEVLAANKPGVHGATLYPCYPDLDKVTLDANTDPDNYDICLPTHVKVSENPSDHGDSIDNIVRVIEEYPMIHGSTPIAEALYEIYGYVSQRDNNVNKSGSSAHGKHFYPNGQTQAKGKPSYKVNDDWDPYYYTDVHTDGDGTFDPSTVSCCKTHVINITAEGPFNDWDNITQQPFQTVAELDIDGDGDIGSGETDPVATNKSFGYEGNTPVLDDIALYLRETDIRSDIPEHQEIISYVALAGSTQLDSSTLNKMMETAANGGFRDFDQAQNQSHSPDPAHTADFSILISNNSTTVSEVHDGVTRLKTVTSCPSSTVNEWDLNKDCIPDNFINTEKSGKKLISALRRSLNSIHNEAASGASASIIASSSNGAGILYNSLYFPKNRVNGDKDKDDDYNSGGWGGLLHALFIDDQGNFRENNVQVTDEKPTLDNPGDNIVKIEYNKDKKRAMVTRYKLDINGELAPLVDGEPATPQPLSSLKPIWEARDELAAITSPETHRAYTSNSQTGRYIFTGMNTNNDDVIDKDETVYFVAAHFDDDTVVYDSKNVKSMKYLGIKDSIDDDDDKDAEDAALLVDYIRGKEDFADGTIDNMRRRTIGGSANVWRLGDIVHSTPAVVAAPVGTYDTIYNDDTYKDFKDKYKDRRQMVYVGANDGMLHAFNGGFWDSANSTYIAPPNSEVEYKLGAEMWAYVPYNLLPHLQWLVNKEYRHTYYVDGSPKVFDARVFPDNGNGGTETYPNGWGTLLAVNMRLGGGPFRVKLGRVNNNDIRVTMRSALMIFDITNPEVEPKLLAEISHPRLGFTTSQPELIAHYQGQTAANDSAIRWELVFGSGPDNLDSFTRRDADSNHEDRDNAHLFLLNLMDLGFDGTISLDNENLGATFDEKFIGDITAADWNKDGNDEKLYFGTVGGTAAAATGDLYRLDISSSGFLTGATPSSIISTSTDTSVAQPFPNKPLNAFDKRNNGWIYTGSGRLFTGGDHANTETQSFYGLKEYSNGNQKSTVHALTTARSEDMGLQNVTGIRVFKNSAVDDTNSNLPTTYPGTSDAFTFPLMEKFIDESKSGWHIDFTTDVNDPKPTKRVTNEASNYKQLILFSNYEPAKQIVCQTNLGSSELYAVYGRTGTAYPNAGLGNQACSLDGLSCPIGDPDETKAYTALGLGQASRTTLYKDFAITKMGSGEISKIKIKGVPVRVTRQSWREIF